MRMSEYQQLAQRTSRHDLDMRQHLFNGILGLVGEAGEVADLVKKHYYQDGRRMDEHLCEELGDVLWYIAEIAEAMGFDLDDVAEMNIAKLRKRYPDGFEADRSLHREE